MLSGSPERSAVAARDVVPLSLPPAWRRSTRGPNTALAIGSQVATTSVESRLSACSRRVR